MKSKKIKNKFEGLTFNLKLSTSNSAGLTLIELLVVIGLFSLLASLGLFINLGFYRTYSLNSERDTLISILRKVRSESITNTGQVAHGIHMESNRYVVFQGGSYAVRDTSKDQVFSLSPATTLSGPSEIIFTQLSGSANQSANISIKSGTDSRNITVNGEGQINW